MKDVELNINTVGLPIGVTSSGVSFSPQTIKLIGLLEDRSQRFDLAAMLKGAWVVLESADNPDMLSQAGHSMRELIEKAPFSIPEVPLLASNPRERMPGETRRIQIKAAIRTLAGNDGRVSEQIVESLSQIVMDLRSYFMDDTAHHGRQSTEAEMRAKIIELEDLLLNLLNPESINDLDEIDSLIAQGEQA